jgi:hypothetical protein
MEAAPKCHFEKATNYRQAVERMMLLTYDLVVLDNIGIRGFDLLELAVARNFPAVMLTDYALRWKMCSKINISPDGSASLRIFEDSSMDAEDASKIHFGKNVKERSGRILENYVLRIYRRKKNDPRILVGVLKKFFC